MADTRDCSIGTVSVYTVTHHVPWNVLFELTHRCNLRCGHCYAVDRHERELSLGEIQDVLRQLAAENCLFLTFTGGEALARAEFLEIAEFAHKLGFMLKVFTNGTLLDEAVARRLATLEPIHVGISLYGAGAETHDRATGVAGSFARSVKALSLLHELGVVTMAKCLVMKENAAELPQTQQLVNRLGAILQLDVVVAPKNDGNRDPLEHQLDDDGLYRVLSSEVIIPKRTMRVGTSPSGSLICRAGMDVCCISPGGDVYPCVSMPVSLGNLREQSFSEVWRGPTAERFRQFRFADLHQCVSCPDLDYCIRCWGLALVESGNHLGPSYLNCRVARMRHRILREREYRQMVKEVR